MDALNFVQVAGEQDMYVVFQATRDQLENAPEYQDPQAQQDQATQDQAQQDQAAQDQPVQEQPAQDQPAQAENQDQAAEEPVAAEPVQSDDNRLGVRDPAEGFAVVDFTALTAEDLQNAVVYDRFDEQVAGITDLVLADDGTTVEGVLIDVGGFLGLGARTVAVGMDQLQIQHNPDTDEVRVYLSMTQEELENLPDYNN